MFKFFFKQNYFNKVGFEDILLLFEHKKDLILINTLPISEQSYLIQNTVTSQTEESIINESLNNYSEHYIIIYGKNSTDLSIETKYCQLRNLGFSEDKLFIYYGGLFEWSLLQDIYGDTFKTTSIQNDLLKFKPLISDKIKF
jgi:hypothetical protein